MDNHYVKWEIHLEMVVFILSCCVYRLVFFGGAGEGCETSLYIGYKLDDCFEIHGS